LDQEHQARDELSPRPSLPASNTVCSCSRNSRRNTRDSTRTGRTSTSGSEVWPAGHPAGVVERRAAA
jgi:hypothetical protein